MSARLSAVGNERRHSPMKLSQALAFFLVLPTAACGHQSSLTEAHNAPSAMPPGGNASDAPADSTFASRPSTGTEGAEVPLPMASAPAARGMNDSTAPAPPRTSRGGSAYEPEAE